MNLSANLGAMDETYNAVSMQVSDTGGEISASVEETNRVRAALGLKPLKDTADNGGGADQQRNREEEARVRGQERAAEMARADAEDAMREKLDAARRQRLLHQKLTGTSLGEQLAGEEMDSAAAWVAKSRGQEMERKERNKEARAKKAAAAAGRAALAAQSAMYDELDDALGGGGGGGGGGSSSMLAGAVVGHAADDFAPGESVVLTLADQPVVRETGGGTNYALNDETEMLENVNMAEAWRRQQA